MKMKPHSILVIPFLLTCLSFAFGFHSYKNTKQRIANDLNQALRKSVAANMHCWLCKDSIQTYAKLQKIMDAPVAINSTNEHFSEALKIKEIRPLAGIMIHVLKEKEQKNIIKQIPDNVIASDTVVWLSPTVNATSEGLFVSLQGYAQCPVTTILALSNQTWAEIFLLMAIIMGAYYFYLCRKQQRGGLGAEKDLVHFGNLTLCYDKNCFVNEQRDKLKLTPMQYALMEMFFLSSSHQLPKADICDALWPGKENADETLYTLIRRLKPIVEEQSNLKITADRGRAYVLEVKS